MTSEPILTVDNLSVAFNSDSGVANVVNNINLHLEEGETLALVGESGSGKSVTAHSILRLLPYPNAFHPSGKILFQNRNLLDLPLKEIQKIRGNHISMIFQEPMTALNPLHTVEKQIGEILTIHQGLNKQQARAVTLSLLEQVRIDDPSNRMQSYPHQLSGGQRQRVMIAMALANDPDVLIADEPTTALDVTVQQSILSLLKELQQARKMSILLITHDLGVVQHVADRVAVMNHGNLVETAATSTLFNNPQDEYTRTLLYNQPKGNAVKLTAPIGSLPTLVKTEELNVSFAKDKPLFRRPKHFFHAVKQASLSLKKGSTLGIVGESGSGKSTLALAMLRLIESTGGIYFEEQPLQQLNQKQLRPLRRHMQIVFQDPFSSLSPRMTIKQIISEGLELHYSLSDEIIDQRIISIMEEVGLDPNHRHRYSHEFSGGQRQRIAIARVLVLDPKIIFLDEPTSALDRTVQIQVVDLLKKLQSERGISYVFITHDIQVVKAISHQVIVMRDGEIIEQGDAEQVLTNPKESYTQALISTALAL